MDENQQREDDLRSASMHHALHWAERYDDVEPERVVETAAAFLAFLRGDN